MPVLGCLPTCGALSLRVATPAGTTTTAAPTRAGTTNNQRVKDMVCSFWQSGVRLFLVMLSGDRLKADFAGGQVHIDQGQQLQIVPPAVAEEQAGNAVPEPRRLGVD